MTKTGLHSTHTASRLRTFVGASRRLHSRHGRSRVALGSTAGRLPILQSWEAACRGITAISHLPQCLSATSKGRKGLFCSNPHAMLHAKLHFAPIAALRKTGDMSGCCP